MVRFRADPKYQCPPAPSLLLPTFQPSSSRLLPSGSCLSTRGVAVITQFIAFHRLHYPSELQPAWSPCQAFCRLCPPECEVWSATLIREVGNSEQWIGNTGGRWCVGETWGIRQGCEEPRDLLRTAGNNPAEAGLRLGDICLAQKEEAFNTGQRLNLGRGRTWGMGNPASSLGAARRIGILLRCH